MLVESPCRRVHKGVQSVLVLAISFGTGCGLEDAGTGTDGGGGTGVAGLNTPAEILSNPFVASAIDQAQGAGVDLRLFSEPDPPVISGRYDISGTRYLPSGGALSGGTWIWRNQTADNRIETEYSQLVQTGVSSLGEIIRGAGNAFTVYSIVEVTDASVGCSERVVFIFDGRQSSTGDVSGVYVGAPLQQVSCYAVSTGTVDLDLSGAAKAIEPLDSTPGGETLLGGASP